MNVIVTSVRNEAPWILEWIAYHKALGFDYFIFYTNDNTDETVEVLVQLEAKGILEVHENTLLPEQSPQRFAFSKGFKRLSELKPDWVLCSDVDEYLVLKKEKSIKNFLANYSDCDAIGFNWNHFGSSGLTEHNSGFTTERFTRSGETAFFMNRMLKSIFKFDVKKLKGFGPHRPWYKDGIEPKYVYPSGEYVSPKFWKDGFNLISDESAPIEHDIACMHHYSIRSLSEYLVKVARGNGMKANNKKSHFKDDYFKTRDVNTKEDLSALTLLAEQKEIFDNLKNKLSK